MEHRTPQMGMANLVKSGVKFTVNVVMANGAELIGRGVIAFTGPWLFLQGNRELNQLPVLVRWNHVSMIDFEFPEDSDHREGFDVTFQ